MSNPFREGPIDDAPPNLGYEPVPAAVKNVPASQGEIDLSVYVKAEALSGQVFNRFFIVENFIESGRIYVWFGKWKSGKTLVVIDMTFHACLGRIWGGRRTENCVVVYVAGEAVEDIKQRLAALQIYHEIEEDLPFYVRTRPVYLTDVEWASQLKGEVEAISLRHPGLRIIIVIDTLARNFGPGQSENGEAMGDFANNLIDYIARPINATCIVVHHSGHGDNDRGRGGSALPAAVDGTIKVGMSNNIVTVKPLEMRSSGELDELSFRIKIQDLPGSDNFGNGVNAPVLEYTGNTAGKKKERIGGKAGEMLKVLQEMYVEQGRVLMESGVKGIARVSYGEWRKKAEKILGAIDKGQFSKIVKSLEEDKHCIKRENGFCYLVDIADV